MKIGIFFNMVQISVLHKYLIFRKSSFLLSHNLTVHSLVSNTNYVSASAAVSAIEKLPVSVLSVLMKVASICR